jgi:hypothetical protein
MKMQIIFRGAVSVAACLVLVGCAADGDPSDDSTNGATAIGSPTASATEEPAWRDEYSQAELAAYEEALDRWMTYEQRSAPIWAAGKATPAARELFEEFFPSPLWQELYDRLETFEENEVAVPRLATVFWSRASKIQLEKGTQRVTIEQCVDLTAKQTTQYGKPVPFPKEFREPLIRTIVLDQPEGYPWLIYLYPNQSVDGVRRCDKEDL